MKSMTGYYNLQHAVGRNRYSVEMKSVNNRYLDISLHMPHYLYPYELDIKQEISGTISRGKIDVYVDVKCCDQTVHIEVDEELARHYLLAYQRVKRAVGIGEPIPVEQILAAEGVVTAQTSIDGERVWKKIHSLLEQCVQKFDRMRIKEGTSTRRDLLKILKGMRSKLRNIKKQTSNQVIDFKEELQRRLEKLAGDQVDENRILTEAAVLATRADVNEEIARLESHFDLFASTADRDEPVGRALDFVCQEMNREINTIGSKQNQFSIAELVVGLKTDLERIREQLRNVE